MSAVSDRAKDFWDRISPRERMLVVLAAIAAPITIAIWLGLSISDGLGDMEKRNTKMRRALIALTDLRARGPLQPADDVVSTMGTEPLSLDTYVRNAASKAGFSLRSTTPHNPVTKNGFVTNSLSLSLDDLELEKVKTFLHDIETSSRVVVVTHLDIKRDFKDKTRVDAKLEISTYSKEKKPGEGEAEAPEGDAEKKGG